MTDAIINVQDLCFSYDAPEGEAPIVLDSVTLSIDPGSFVAVLGHNG